MAVHAGSVARDEPVIVDAGEGPVVGFALWYRTFSTFLGRPGIHLEDLLHERGIDAAETGRTIDVRRLDRFERPRPGRRRGTWCSPTSSSPIASA